MENDKLRKLLPVSPSPHQSSYPAFRSLPVTKTKRVSTAAACERCRRKKAKCDGQRASCGRCLEASADCVYDVDPGETRGNALKRTYKSLQNDRDELDELIGLLQTRSEDEAMAILHHLRSKADPLEALKMVKESELLLQAHGKSKRDAPAHNVPPTKSRFVSLACESNEKEQTLLDEPQQRDNPPSPRRPTVALSKDPSIETTSSRSDSDRLLTFLQFLHSGPEAEVEWTIRKIRSMSYPSSISESASLGSPRLQQLFQQPRNEAEQEKLESLDAEALRSSSVKVSARSWTAVAGDGLVSHLISVFFDQEQPFSMPFVEKENLIKEMALGDPTRAKFISPLLINTICAVSSFTSRFVAAFDSISKGNLQARFYHEARMLLDNEQGKPSLPTTEALLLLYVYNSSCARDRAGLIFRFAGAEMFQRQKLGATLGDSKAVDTKDMKYQKLRARSAWGMFHFESMCAFMYLQPSLIPPPYIPRHFSVSREQIEYRGPLIGADEILDLQADISKIFYRLVTYCAKPAGEVGQAKDLSMRRHFFDELLSWDQTIPPLDQFEEQFFCEHSQLKSHFHVTMIVVLQPILCHRVIFPDAKQTPDELCIHHCRQVLKCMDTWKDIRPFELDSGSMTALFHCYVPIFSLVAILDLNKAGWKPFTEFCEHLARYSTYWPAAGAVLKGCYALAQKLHVTVPTEALPHLKGSIVQSDPSDVPVSWNVPQYTQLLEQLSAADEETDELISTRGVDVGRLITRQNSLEMG